LLTFLTLWLTFHPGVSFFNCLQQNCLTYGCTARTQALSPFTDSSIDYVLLQTNTDFTSHFLNS